MQYEGKTVWITGASSGIGAALARRYHNLGANVIISSRRKNLLQALRDDLQDPQRIYPLPLDLEDHDAIPKAADLALSKWGSVDILINNAGISQRSKVAETDFKVFKKLIDVNFLGLVEVTRAVLPKMIQKGEGRIAAISSIAGIFATPMRSGYSASKMALQGFCDALRAEVHERGISVTVVHPGFVKTEISKNALTGNGSKYSKMDTIQEGGISPEICAAKIIRAIEKRKRKLHTGLILKTRFALFLSRFAPGLLARIIRKAKVT